jgi:hypothetical protein
MDKTLLQNPLDPLSGLRWVTMEKRRSLQRKPVHWEGKYLKQKEDIMCKYSGKASTKGIDM